jgi:subtilase family serine protease
VTDTTRNQGTGSAAPSVTSFYLSRNFILETSDPLLGSRSIGTLAAGTASSGTVSLVLPNDLDAGTYYVFAKADGNGVLSETNESNNTRLTSLAVGPDLIVTAMSAPPLAAAGANILVSDTTVNQGGEAAPASSTRFFLSANVLLDAADTPLQARSMGALAPGASSSGSTSVTIPAGTVSGSYYLFAQADGSTSIPEPNEANNSRLTTIRIGADLTVSGFTAPARAAAGSTITVTDTTTNAGAGPAAASTTAFFLSSNLMLDGADMRLQPSRAVPLLGAGGSSTGTTTLTLPNVPAGGWFLLANADDGNVVPETGEGNNVRFAGLQIGPDLTFLSVASPSSGVAGTSITITDTVRNFGLDEAAATVVRYYLSTNAALDAADIQLNAGRAVPALAPNASNTGSATVPLPSGTTGSFWIIVVADGDHTLAESSEFNNTIARLIQIAAGS